jgi:hypothetical protein
MTGAIVRNYTAASDDPVLKIASHNFDINIFKVYSGDQTYKNTGVYGYNLVYNGTGSGVDNKLTLNCDNQNAATQVIGWQLNQAGQMGIGTSVNISYRLTVNGSLNATTIYQNGTTLANTYLGKTAKAADSDKLDGQDGSYYLNYDNFTNTPTIPTVNNGTLTMSTSGTGVSGSATFTANQSTASTFTVTLDSSAAGNRGANKVVLAKAAGQIDSDKFTVTSSGTTKSTIQYNTTEGCLEFVFA